MCTSTAKLKQKLPELSFLFKKQVFMGVVVVQCDNWGNRLDFRVCAVEVG